MAVATVVSNLLLCACTEVRLYTLEQSSRDIPDLSLIHTCVFLQRTFLITGA